MRVYLGSDHAGYDLKQHLIEWLNANGHEAVDCGPAVQAEAYDYPVFCLRAGEAVAKDPGSLGIVLGGSGNGEQIAANKVKGVRAALVWREDIAALAREHNNANVISLGARMHTAEEAAKFVQVFLDTPFSEAPRHIKRIDQMSVYETTGELPPLPEA